jgi:hypothetical protein
MAELIYFNLFKILIFIDKNWIKNFWKNLNIFKKIKFHNTIIINLKIIMKINSELCDLKLREIKLKWN